MTSAWCRALSLIALLASSACDLEFTSTVCGDGTVCPSGWECAAEGGGRPPSASFCPDRADGAACTTEEGAEGTCEAEVCVANVCGDGVVEGSEACDGGDGPLTCVQLGYDHGRARCDASCRGSVADECGHLGWRDLELAEPIDAVLVVGATTWAVGPTGAYRQAGRGLPWERVDARAWKFITGAGDDDVWAFGAMGPALRCTGSTCRDAEAPSGIINFAAMRGDRPVVGGQLTLASPAIWTWNGASWEEQGFPTPSGALASRAEAFATLGAEEVVAVSSSFLLGLPPVSSTSSQLLRWDGSTWAALPGPPLGGGVASIAGRDLSDFLVTGDVIVGNDTLPVTYRISVELSPGGGTTTSAVVPTGEFTGGVVEALPADAGEIVLGADSQAHLLLRGASGLAPIESPGLVTAASATAERLVAVTSTGLLELGTAVWSIPVASPQAFPVRAQELTLGRDSETLHVVPGGSPVGLTWRLGASAPSPTIAERGLAAEVVGLWGDSTLRLAVLRSFASNSLRRLTGVADLDLGIALGAVDIDGNSETDALIVGRGPAPATYWDGAVATPVVAGLPAGAKFTAVVATGAGTFVAVGDGGLIARFDAAQRTGTPWTVVTSGTSADLRALAALDRDRFVAVGDGGTAVRCAPICVVDTLPLDQDLTGVAQAALDDVWAVGGATAWRFDGVGWTEVRLSQVTPSSIVKVGPFTWFGGRRLERLIQLRPWT